MKGYHIYFIRHGSVDNSRYCGHTDISLSENGKCELSELLSIYDFPNVEAIFSSPLKRCLETGGIIYPNQPILIMDEYSELNLGDFENKTIGELVNDSDFKSWLKGESSPPNGESVAELTVRLYSGLIKTIRYIMDNDIRQSSIITHSGVIVNIMTSFGIPKFSPEELFLRPGEGIEVFVTSQLWQQAKAFEILGKVPISEK